MTLEEPQSTADLSDFELEDQAIAARRVQAYSTSALKKALPIDGLFIGHTAFTTALQGLDRVFQLATEVNMPHGLRLIGPPGSGKTSLLHYFQRSLPSSSLFEQGLGAVYLRVAKRPSVSYLVSSLLRRYGYPVKHVGAATLEPRINIVLEAIRQKGTRLIILDEAQNLVSGVLRRSQIETGNSPTDFIRLLMDEARVGVVLAGSKALDEIGDFDDALKSRAVGRFHLDDFAYDKVWLGLIQGFVKQCDWYDIAVFMEPEINRKLYDVAQGNLRATKRLITESALVAADEGASAVTARHVQKAYTMIYGTASQKANPYDQRPA